MRLNKYLAKAGGFARRKSDNYILSGMVFINGKRVDNPGYQIDEQKDEIFINNKRIVYKEKYRYIVLNKPKRCVTTLHDEMGRLSVIDNIDVKERIFPVGRLDIDTTGILILTNDGELAYRLSHPKFEIDKVYIAELDKPVVKKDIGRLANGVDIGNDEVVTAEVDKINEGKNLVRISIHTGKKRQIKRMFSVLGYNVLELDRILFGGISKDNINLGCWRNLTTEEVTKLKQLVS